MKVKFVIGCIVGLLLFGVGIVVFAAGMFRLGWGVHGKSLLDFRFLHLDWIFQPDLPYWKAHMANLSTALVGLLCITAPVVVGAWYGHLWLRRRRG